MSENFDFIKKDLAHPEQVDQEKRKKAEEETKESISDLEKKLKEADLEEIRQKAKKKGAPVSNDDVIKDLQEKLGESEIDEENESTGSDQNTAGRDPKKQPRIKVWEKPEN